jgi:CheY-like chemotaxis protein
MEAIGSLAGGVAHDFNNLLTVILGHVAFALEAVDETGPVRDDLLQIRAAGESAAGLTRQLLAFGRKQLLQPKLLDLNQLISEFEKMLRRILGEDLELVLVLERDLHRIMADPGQLEQVLMNLVVNARDAMPGGGRLVIETRNAELDEAFALEHPGVAPGAFASLSISDSGCGMDQETQQRIFEPFFTTKERGKGTGLGLSTVYGIVKQSGGTIWVQSEPGRGTTFRVYFPCEPSAVRIGSGEQAAATCPRGDETILVVEDEEVLLRLAKRILVTAGYTVLTAANGVEALRVGEAHRGELHLVLTDVVMPQMGGRAMAERLAALCPGLKVLYVSGFADSQLGTEDVLEAGLQFLAKPFTSVSLTRKVREVLDG